MITTNFNKRNGLKITMFLCGIIITLLNNTYAQPPKQLTIAECYALAKQQYPLAKQKDLIESSKEYSIANACKGYFPQLNINGQATYQSEVTEIPISIPGMSFPTTSKDQYKIAAEIYQPLTDMVVIQQQVKLTEINAIIEQQKLEVELYKLKDRINQLFFGTLLINEQQAQIKLLKKDIENAIAKMNAAITNGIALKSSADILKAELLKINQRAIELEAAHKVYLEMLGLFINQSINEGTILEKPKEQITLTSINRPELVLFDHQDKVFDVQDKLLTVKNLPRAGIFFQEGYGRPTLNMLDNDFGFYYIGGIRFNWSLSGFYILKKEREILNINRNLLNIQKETFLFNTNILLKQQNSEITKLQELIDIDNDIIALRTSIKNSANSQLENGVITANDYVREVNAEDQAKQNLLLHKIQLLMAQYNYQSTAGN